ncbi:MAG: phosphopyruvate hydratase [Myxococcota bacterium]|nr:phosphopyruvate hydratase [Myxococcota bacterium]
MMAQAADIVLEARQASDSRGRPTVEVTLKVGGIETVGDVPAGASKGEDEARTVGVEQAIDNIHGTILSIIRESGRAFESHDDLLAIEAAIIAQAGENYVTLGANSVLPVSRALWKAAAKLRGMELCHYIREFEPKLNQDGRVSFLMNIFNGGLHALKEADGEVLGRDRIDIQEIMVVPFADTYALALEMGDKIDAALKDILVGKFGADTVTRADEAGFSVKGLGDSTEAFDHVFEAIRRAGYEPGKDVKLSLDVAASSFYDREERVYLVQGKKLSSSDMTAYLLSLVDRYEGCMLSVEDGLDENDWDEWPLLTAELTKRGVTTVGDDLFVTQLPRLEQGIECKAATAILIKVNQNGSMSGTLDVMKRAREAGMKCVISHRSGETLDDSIADIAYGTGSMGLKTGDPQPVVDFPDESTWVRRRKYLRMVEIEKLG